MTYLPRSNFGRFSTPFAAADIARTGKPGGPVKAPPAPEIQEAAEDKAVISPK